jgi:hypothetical protein
VLGETGAAVSLCEGGSVASLGEDAGVVVLGGCCTRFAVRWPPPTPDETVNRPANTRTANAAATTTAAPMTPAPTTKALLIPRVSRRDATRGAPPLIAGGPPRTPPSRAPVRLHVAPRRVRFAPGNRRRAGSRFQSFEPPSHPPHPLRGGRTRKRSRRLVRPVGGWRHPGTLTGRLLCAPGGLLKANVQEVPRATRSQRNINALYVRGHHLIGARTSRSIT